MFRKIASQHAEHSSGFSVFVADREHAGYTDSLVSATIGADFLCGIVPLYANTLKVTPTSHLDGELISGELIMKRIREGLAFLGINSELVEE